MTGCPTLEQLCGDAATGGSLRFPRKTKAPFIYAGGSSSELTEELYSDTREKLSRNISKIFDAMVSCPIYQVVSDSAVIDMGTQQTTAPNVGGGQWSRVITYSVGGRRSVVKQTAVRAGNVLAVVARSSGLVDFHLEKTLGKAQTAAR
ncbi:hypothetical protein [Streptomyces sp. NPDC003077]|uniref:hypothetical protein n=1 Tax=Streptomyces sp. NPDC003077 TaxID=3154443 RepID=UPI0033A56D19